MMAPNPSPTLEVMESSPRQCSPPIGEQAAPAEAAPAEALPVASTDGDATPLADSLRGGKTCLEPSPGRLEDNGPAADGFAQKLQAILFDQPAAVAGNSSDDKASPVAATALGVETSSSPASGSNAVPVAAPEESAMS